MSPTPAREPAIVIAESLAGGSLAAFHAISTRVVYEPGYARDRASLLAAVREADALVVRNTVAVDRELLDAAPRLVAIGRLGTGLENIDVASARERGIAIADAGDANAAAVAEYVIAALFALERNVANLDRAVRAGAWPRFEFPARELGGKTLGIAGLGRCGSRLARLGAALGMRVLGVRATPGLPPALAGLGVERVDKEELLTSSDYVVLALPALGDARPYLLAPDFERMAAGAVLVNAGRGSLVDERALLAALDAGRPRAAILDTRASEPPAPGDALAAHPRVLSTPHVAGLTAEAQARVCEVVARGLARALGAA